jgi:hypothetical protein
MFNLLVIVSLALAGQVSGAPDQYATGQTGAGNTSGNPAASGGISNNVTPLPANNGSGRNASTSPGSGSSGVSPPPNFKSQPLSPLPEAGAAGIIGGQAQSPAANLQGRSQFQGQSPPVLPADNAAAQQNNSTASALMKLMLTPPPNSKLGGQPVRLVEVIGSGRSRLEQAQRVEAYWDLCSSLADYYLGLLEQEEMRKLASYVSQPGAELQQAGRELDVRVGTSQRAARASQLRLASMIGRGTNNLPLPADLPHCGSYTTHYQENFARRNVPEAQELAELLPQRYTELKNAAADVASAEDWLHHVASNTGNNDGTGSVQALEFLALRRRAFVQIARDYNRRIARYAELASPGTISAERLTAMLVMRPASTATTRPSSPAPPPGKRSSSVDSSPPPTFVNGVKGWTPPSTSEAAGAMKRDDAVQPASGSQQDHSLLLGSPK